MTVEDKYLLWKPGYGDTADIGDINHNTDLIANGMYQNRLMIGKAYNPDRAEPYMKDDLVVKQTTVLEDGEPVAYNFEYYKALEDNITGVWDASKWGLTDVATELSTKGGADVTKTASGNPITFDDGASAPLVKCDVAIIGSQDLHGYDKPWVGGAGKNKYNATKITETADGITITKNEFGEYTVTGTATALHQFALGTNTIKAGDYILNGCPSGGGTSTYDIRFTNNAIDNGSGATLHLDSDTSDSIYITVRNGYSFPTGGLVFKPMIRLSTETDATYEPYSNICPITAYTEGEIEVRGRNLYPIKIGDDSFSPNAGGSASNDSGTLVVTTTSTSYSGVYTALYSTFDNMTKELVGEFTYSFYAKSSANLRAVLGITNYGRGEFNLTTTWQRISMTATFPGTKLALLIYSRGAAGTIYIKDFMVERGNTPHAYEEYIAPTTHTTTYPSAIYRGSEDVVNGEVGTEWRKIVFDGSNDEQWYFSINAGARSQNVAYINISDIAKRQTPIANLFEGLSNRSYNDLNPWQCASPYASGNETYVNFVVDKTLITSISDWRTWLSNNNLEFAYQLENPETETVTPTNLPIRTLSGYTHIESTTGDMEIEYITQDYQPLVDLIESNSGKHVYSTEEQVVGTWIDGSVLYEKTLSFTAPNITKDDSTSDLVHGVSNIDVAWVETALYKSVNQGISRYQNIICATMFSSFDIEGGFSTWEVGDRSIYSLTTTYSSLAGREFVFTIRYTKSTTPTRSLNLTKSAVTDSKDEIPDEIKNAPFEEKPETNEADDSAPTEVDER